MDPLLAAAARALATGNPLGALNVVALRDEAPALALRGIAMAQIGELDAARRLLKRAARGFGAREAVARARCVVAQAEIAFVSRDLGWPVKTLAAARATLEEHGDLANAAHAGHLQARRCLLLGRPVEAERILGGIEKSRLPPARITTHEMIEAGIAMRRLETKAARDALARAERAARRTGIPALLAEVRSASRLLEEPAARQIRQERETLLRLDEVEALLKSEALVVDACRNVVRQGRSVVPLGTRPVLLALARVLAETWPEDVPRSELIRRAFEARNVDDSHRARLRVEIGRLRKLLRTMADVRATERGFVLRPRLRVDVHVLAWPVDAEHATALAFLSDGEAWSSSALALALGVSQRTVQRSLDALAEAGRVQWFGRGRARRWTAATLPGFTTLLLLTPPIPDEVA
jgi:hypothetical protein